MLCSVLKDIRFPFLLLLLLIQGFLLVRLDWTTSPNRTELGHIAASMRLWETGEFDMFHVNPPLLRFLIGSAISCSVHPNTDWNDYSSDPSKRSEWACGVAFIRANDLDTIQKSFFLGRVLCIPLILLGSYFGCRFARELFGEVSGFIFLLLWVFSPLILGWGATICPDVVSASLGMIALYAFRHWLKEPAWIKTLLAGITLGLLPLTKLTWIVAPVTWIIIWLLVLIGNRKNVGKQFVQMVLLLFIAVLTINAGYLFDSSFKQLGNVDFHSKALTNADGTNCFSGTLLGTLPIPLPEHFVLGFDTQKVDFENGLPSYLLGTHSEHGWLYYYVIALAVKEPLGTVLLAVIALVLFCFRPFRAAWRDEAVLAVPLLTLFLMISSQTGFSLHSRYIIPLLPFFYIGMSRVGLLTSEAVKQKLTIGLVLVLIFLSNIFSVLSLYPHSMSYINEAARDRIPPVLLGSNLDWGQDYYELKEYLDEHPEAKPLRVAFSNIFPLDALGIKNAGLPPHWTRGQKEDGTLQQQIKSGPQPGWFLLGANELFGAGNNYQWLWDVKPVKRIGYSLYLYNVTLDEANQLRENFDLPMLLEEDLIP